MRKTLSNSMNDYPAVEHRFWYFAVFILASLGLISIGFFGVAGGVVAPQGIMPHTPTTVEEIPLK